VHRAAPECISRLDHSSIRAAKQYIVPGLDLEAAALVSHERQSRMKTDSAFGAPGRTPRELARSAERELSFDPQSKAELAQGEYKGAREVLARHVHTAQPWGGPGGGAKDPTVGRPSRVGCALLMTHLMALANVGGANFFFEHPRELRRPPARGRRVLFPSAFRFKFKTSQ
jgi:hypothetical protein